MDEGIANAGVLGRGGSRTGDQLRRHADLQTDGDSDINTASDLKGKKQRMAQARRVRSVADAGLGTFGFLR